MTRPTNNLVGHYRGVPLRWHALPVRGEIRVTCMVVLPEQTIVKVAGVPLREWRQARWQRRKLQTLILHLETMVKTHEWRAAQ